jgi:NAD(P)-dependent dehydrogenase (short-subunit alcohol dehydrogenase family)
MTKPRTVLITGAGQGLGLEWARQEAEDGAMVIATARDPGQAPDLKTLARARPGNVVVAQMDVTDQGSVEACARKVGKKFAAIDDLVNNAGTYGPRGDHALAGPPSEVSRVLEVNTVGPYRVTQAFLPLLRQGVTPRILFVTSRMGSIGDAPSGASYAYRMSKTALNMLGANLASDLRNDGILCLLLHPGWARTRMGGGQAPLPVADSVAGLRRVVRKATLAHTGAFLDHTGAIVPW